MVKITEGDANGKGLRVGIVVSRFNQEITEKLLSGCLQELRALSVDDGGVHVVWVPGAFEIAIALEDLAESKRCDVLIALGCVIKGKTLHFETVVKESAEGVSYVSRKWALPIIYEVLSCLSYEDAQERVSGTQVHRGMEAARAAVEMATCRKKLARGL